MSLVLNLLLLEMLSFTSGPQAGAKENSSWKFIKFVKKRSVLKIAKLWLRWSSMMGTNTLSSSLGFKIMQCSLWFHPEIPKSLKSWMNMHVSCSILVWWCVTALTILNMYKAFRMYVHDSSPYGFTWNRREISCQVLDHLTIDFLYLNTYHGSLPLKGSLNSGVGPLLHLLTMLVAMFCWFLILPKSRSISTVRQGRFEMFLIFLANDFAQILICHPHVETRWFTEGYLPKTSQKPSNVKLVWKLSQASRRKSSHQPGYTFQRGWRASATCDGPPHDQGWSTCNIEKGLWTNGLAKSVCKTSEYLKWIDSSSIEWLKCEAASFVEKFDM